jgi:hypothetical protein
LLNIFSSNSLFSQVYNSLNKPENKSTQTRKPENKGKGIKVLNKIEKIKLLGIIFNFLNQIVKNKNN